MGKKTPFYEKHINFKGKMVNFADFEMPLQFRGIIPEHLKVRSSVGIFDVSHMGRVEIIGKDATEFVNWIVTNDVTKLANYQGIYTVMCYENGGIVDDLVVYKLPEKYLAVINAANTSKDLEWMRSNKRGDIEIKDVTQSMAQLAVQGPLTEKTLQPLTSYNLRDIKYYWGAKLELANVPMFISRTGYTGEDGFELYFDAKYADRVWDNIMAEGKKWDIEPCGLGARDTLRLEMKYCLYGNDITEDRNPIEAKLSWVVKFDKPNFIGKDALLKIKEKGVKETLVAFIIKEKKGIPRPHNKIFNENGKEIGTVTSGTFSPSLKNGIGMGYVLKEFDIVGNEILVETKGGIKKAEIIKPPFYKKGSINK